MPKLYLRRVSTVLHQSVEHAFLMALRDGCHQVVKRGTFEDYVAYDAIFCGSKEQHAALVAVYGELIFREATADDVLALVKLFADQTLDALKQAKTADREADVLFSILKDIEILTLEKP